MALLRYPVLTAQSQNLLSDEGFNKPLCRSTRSHQAQLTADTVFQSVEIREEKSGLKEEKSGIQREDDIRIPQKGVLAVVSFSFTSPPSAARDFQETEFVEQLPCSFG